MMDCTRRWRTTSASVNCMKPIPSVPRSTRTASTKPPARSVGRKVDLGRVAGDDGLRFEAETGQEHLHLLRRRVLSLVENHEGVVQGSPAHECERCDLDDITLDQALSFVEIHHVMKRVVERAQVGIDLLGQVAGQKAEFLPSLDGGSRQDDSNHLMAVERCDRQRHGQIRLAGSSGPRSEDHIVVAHELDITPLIQVLRRDPPAAAHAGKHVPVDIPELDAGLFRQHLHGASNIPRLDRLPLAQEAV